jgi:TolB protein
MKSLTSKCTGIFILLIALSFPTFSQTPVGVFENHQDIGRVKHPGSATFSKNTDTYTIKASGTNIWGSKDEFHFVWKKMKGNFIVTAQVALEGKGVDPHRKLGWMVRTDLDSNSANINAVVHGDGLTSLQYRKTKGGEFEESRSPLTSTNVVQLERRGGKYIMSVAEFGKPFIVSEVSDISLGDEVYVGLFVCSHNPDVTESGTFTNVRITIPAKEDFVPYKDYIGSNLEILDVTTGARKVLYSTRENVEAPNTFPDGKALIYNSRGLIYSLDLLKNNSTKINTGTATRNNNDHVLSFDGKMMGISDQSEDGKSRIYTIPASGGTPKKITSKAPSYLHSWSPDGKYLIYTAERNGDYDIYRISSDGKGEEKQLTTVKGLDDGSEYSKDGKFIYFNSSRSGLMQIWRMKADGSEPTQLTNDNFNNWFPHISPDGKWIVYISYNTDVKPDDHPYYKQVYLKMIPAEGGQPSIIAYLYGGQGTINVPSWMPDSKSVAFVGNTDGN